MTGHTRTSKHDLVIPQTMEAAALDRFGPPHVLKNRMLPVPKPGPGQVLIAVHAAGVGVWDQLMRNGSWQPQGNVPLPIVIGTDAAGTVAEIGHGVTNFSVGDRVFAWGYGGFYAEYVRVNADAVGFMPEGLSYVQAAAASASGLTALQGVDDILKIRSGESLLIMGGSGSMGTLAIQFAKHRGAHVLVTASGAEAQHLVRSLGADVVLDARDRNSLPHLEKLFPSGVDAAFVLGSGPTLERYLDHVRPGGRIAYPYGAEPQPGPRPQIRVVGYNLEAGPKEMHRMTHVASEIHLQVPIAAAYPLEDAAQAHERLEQGHILGKIVLRTKLDV